jgi:hypothetical protein
VSERLSIYQQVAGDINKELFDRICKRAWVKKFAFLNIDATQDENDGKYGISFNAKFRTIKQSDEQFYERDAEQEEEGHKNKSWGASENQSKRLPFGQQDKYGKVEKGRKAYRGPKPLRGQQHGSSAKASQIRYV